MTLKVLYTAAATATGGRSGNARSSDGALDLTLVKPASMGGTGIGGTNPEQLFACGYAACFVSTLEFLAKAAKLPLIPPASADVEVDIGPKDGATGYHLAVRMAVTTPGLSGTEAADLLSKAHQTCPYSNAIKGNVEVTITHKAG